MSARGIWPTRPQPGLRSFSLACGPRAFGGGVTDQELTAQLAQARLDPSWPFFAAGTAARFTPAKVAGLDGLPPRGGGRAYGRLG